MLSALVLARASGRTKIKQVLNSLHTRTQFRERKMKRLLLVSLVVFIALGIKVQGEETAPLKLVQTISGIEKSHAVLYREDLDRIYVTDGEAGDLKIFDGKTYRLLSSVKLLEDADSIGYDPATKYLYIDNGGGDVHQTYSMVSVVDTTAGKKLADIKVDGDTLEAMALEKSSSKIYVNNKAKNQVDVIDREKHEVTESWPVTKCKTNVAIGLDEADHRLFVACRSGQISVMDTQAGKELTTLPITKGVDDLKYDATSKRIYAAGDGSVDVYEQTDADNYKKLGTVRTGPLGKTARLDPELNP